MSGAPAGPHPNSRINLEQCRKQAKDLLRGFKGGDPRSLDVIRWSHPHLRGRSDNEIRQQRFVLAEAQLVIARLHHLESWPRLLHYIDLLEKRDPVVQQFEAAVDAVVGGDIDGLSAMLHDCPDLVTRRSARAHHSTLLHYVAANGVENNRQVTPDNIVEIARLLLDAGAPVDAESDAYGGGSTTLGLTATSAHPRLAGVQNELIDLLVDRGASIGELTGAGSVVRAALDHGCPEAAVHLVQRGARLDDIVGAAGVGRLDLVRTLYSTSSVRSRESALLMAAQCDRPLVVDFFLDQGGNPLASDGMSVLHWAAANCNIPMMQALVSLGGGLETLNRFDGTVLSSTLWFAYNASDSEFVRRDFPGTIHWLLATGARDDFYPEMRRDIEGVYRRAAEVAGSSAD